MPSKPARERKTKPSLPLRVGYTKGFAKDWTSLERSGRCDMDRLKSLMMKLIANDGSLEAVHLEHELLGD